MSEPLSANPAGSGLEYLPALDGLRALAVLGVLWHHGPYLFNQSWHARPFWHSSHGGWIGVDLFFVLSGFLITSILWRMRLRPDALKIFWIRRALRIFPLFYVYLTLFCVLFYGLKLFPPTAPHPTTFSGLLPYLLYFGNFQIAVTSWPQGELNILWSLAVEEQFYLVWPLLVLRLSRRTLVALCLNVVVLAPVIRLVEAAFYGPRGVYVLPFGRADTLLLGALLALLWVDPELKVRTLRLARWAFLPALCSLGIIIAGPFGFTDPRVVSGAWMMFGFTWIGLSLAVLVACAAGGGWFGRGLEWRPLVALGRISYGVYLWQWLAGDLIMTLARWIRPELLGTGWMLVPWLLLTLLLSIASWRWLEAPALALKSRWS